MEQRHCTTILGEMYHAGDIRVMNTYYSVEVNDSRVDSRARETGFMEGVLGPEA